MYGALAAITVLAVAGLLLGRQVAAYAKRERFAEVGEDTSRSLPSPLPSKEEVQQGAEYALRLKVFDVVDRVVRQEGAHKEGLAGGVVEAIMRDVICKPDGSNAHTCRGDIAALSTSDIEALVRPMVRAASDHVGQTPPHAHTSTNADRFTDQAAEGHVQKVLDSVIDQLTDLRRTLGRDMSATRFTTPPGAGDEATTAGLPATRASTVEGFDNYRFRGFAST
jgi:hypothetical protein